MKIIEALKKIKELQKKADDLKDKVSRNCAHLDYETPAYQNQGQQITEWLQAHGDVIKEILRLRIAIQCTNLSVAVEIELGGKFVKKSIAEWIHRRRDLADNERRMWSKLTDRGLKEGKFKQSTDVPMDVKIVRYYKAEERDKKVELYMCEPNVIDARLETVNAVTDLIE